MTVPGPPTDEDPVPESGRGTLYGPEKPRDVALCCRATVECSSCRKGPAEGDGEQQTIAQPAVIEMNTV